MNGHLISVDLSQQELNALVVKWEQSFSTADALFREATTVLLKAREAALMVRAQELYLELNPDLLTTQDRGLVLPSTQRLTLYCTLIEEICKELRSTVLTSPVGAVTG